MKIPHPIRHLGAGLLLACATTGALRGAAGDPPPLPAATPGAYASDTRGWIDLLVRPDLADWSRERFPSNRPLDGRNPWSFDSSTGILTCAATGIHEMLLHHTPRADGILHLEFRYVGQLTKPNSGAFVRTLPDASAWYQAQLAPSGLGMVFGVVPAVDGGKPKRVGAGARYPELIKPAGEWNVLEITCHGSEITLWVNGHVTARGPVLTTATGHIGLEAEFNPIEFRRIRFLPR